MSPPQRNAETEVGLSVFGIAGKNQKKRSRNSLLPLKLEVREALLAHLPAGGAVYLAYAGACKVGAAYGDRPLYGAEIRGELFGELAVPVRSWVVADCEAEFPFADLDVAWAAGDFDHFHMPYPALRPFLAGARLLDRVMLVFTDTAHGRLFRYDYEIEYPDGTLEPVPEREQQRAAWKGYVDGYMLPNLLGMLPGWSAIAVEERRRRNSVVWGTVLQCG